MYITKVGYGRKWMHSKTKGINFDVLKHSLYQGGVVRIGTMQ